MRQAVKQEHPQQKLKQILHPSHELCREDILWILEFIGQTLKERNPRLYEWPPARILDHFRHYAEIALMMIHQRTVTDQEPQRIKSLIAEAVSGFCETTDDQKISNP